MIWSGTFGFAASVALPALVGVALHGVAWWWRPAAPRSGLTAATLGLPLAAFGHVWVLDAMWRVGLWLPTVPLALWPGLPTLLVSTGVLLGVGVVRAPRAEPLRGPWWLLALPVVTLAVTLVQLARMLVGPITGGGADGMLDAMVMYPTFLEHLANSFLVLLGSSVVCCVLSLVWTLRTPR